MKLHREFEKSLAEYFSQAKLSFFNLSDKHYFRNGNPRTGLLSLSGFLAAKVTPLLLAADESRVNNTVQAASDLSTGA